MIVLSLHHVDPHPVDLPRYRRFTISPHGLRHAIRSARLLGLQFVSLADVLHHPATFWQAPHRRKILLTFDDAYHNFLTHALPVLQSEHCPATLFAIARQPAGQNDWDPDFPAEPLLPLDQLRLITQTPGITVGSHSLNHARLTTLPPDQLHHELHTSHQILSQALGPAYVPALAYPYGSCNPQVIQQTSQSPYQLAFTIQRGNWTPSTHPLQIPRYCLGWPDRHPLLFLAKLLKNLTLS